MIRYRAILTEPDGTRVVSAVRTVNRTAPQPLVNSVTVAGSLQNEIGCPTDWDPACAASHLTSMPGPTGSGRVPSSSPAGIYEWKVAINDSWDVNYGAGGAAGGDNIPITVPAAGASVTFVWDQVTEGADVHHQLRLQRIGPSGTRPADRCHLRRPAGQPTPVSGL